ncbi:heme-dependent oxidative N-demethylase subunit alpha family protein [Pollutibacter soli]|uniref:heme-dependent oxidative N-demethylase subunit alpha family protein n=1 Tax=Pollutibacter soli TaxID=3034157 RepID=UPI0030141C05
MKYLPFLNGQYSVAPGLFPFSRTDQAPYNIFFHIDHNYKRYITNKEVCRRENLKKYHPDFPVSKETLTPVTEFILSKMISENPDSFEAFENSGSKGIYNLITNEIIQWDTSSDKIRGDKYVSVLDALCSQLQEDFAIWQLTGDENKMIALHICAPNHWAAEDKIGRGFDAVHEPVPGMEKQRPHVQKMLQSVVTKGPFFRFAWGISTDDRLNHHPIVPHGMSAALWHGRKVGQHSPLFIRTEKQNLIGFPEINAFLFTIRTYFYPVDELNVLEKQKLIMAVETMSEDSLVYKGLVGKKDTLKRRILE